MHTLKPIKNYIFVKVLKEAKTDSGIFLAESVDTMELEVTACGPDVSFKKGTKVFLIEGTPLRRFFHKGKETSFVSADEVIAIEV